MMEQILVVLCFSVYPNTKGHYVFSKNKQYGLLFI